MKRTQSPEYKETKRLHVGGNVKEAGKAVNPLPLKTNSANGSVQTTILPHFLS